MEIKKSNTGKIILIVVLVMMILFGGCLFLLSSMGYVGFGKESNKEEVVNDNKENVDNISLLSDDAALLIVKDKVSKYFEYYHSLGVYCGEFDREDYISFGSYENNDFRDYWASAKFNSIEELKKYYGSFMVDDLFPNYLNDENSYIEQDGKLYCKLSHKGCGDTYDDASSSYTITSIDENKIVSNVILISDTCESKNTWKGIVEIIKNSDDNWVVSKYEVMIDTSH